MYSMANLMVSRRCGVGNNHKKPKSICASPAVVMPVVVVVVVIVVEVYISVRLPFAVHFVPFFPFFSVPMSDNVHSQYRCTNQPTTLGANDSLILCKLQLPRRESNLFG